MKQKTVVFRSARVFVEAFLQGWKPLRWTPLQAGTEWAGLEMEVPPSILDMTHRDRYYAIGRIIGWGVIISTAYDSDYGNIKRGVTDRPWTPELKAAYAAIEEAMGPRPVFDRPKVLAKRREEELLQAHGLDDRSVCVARLAVLQQHDLDDESIKKRRKALLDS